MIEAVRKALADHEKDLTITDEGAYIKVKSNHFLDKPTFSILASQIRQLNGEYISAGKDSHFRIPKTPQSNKVTSTKDAVIAGLKTEADELEAVSKTLRRMATDLEKEQ